MGKIYSGDKLYLDDGINFDDSQNWDLEGTTHVDAVLGVSLAAQQYIAHELLTIAVISGLEVTENNVNYVDLMELVPQKFQSSILLQQFLNEAGVQVGSWLGDISDIAALQDPYRVGDEYIQYLADLIGFTFVGSNLTLLDKRTQLLQAITLYKMKGTYNAIAYIGYSLGLSLNFWDMYTTDYVTFYKTPWFVGAVGEEPPGLPNSSNLTYYKTPHMGVEIFLNKMYGALSSGGHLFDSSSFTNLADFIELVRPVNTVPHYSLLLEPVTDESGSVMTVAENISACTVGNWALTKQYFDGTGSVSGGAEAFNKGLKFDQSTTALILAITKFKLGTGHKGVPPANDWTTLGTIVPSLSGNITSRTMYSDRVEFEIVLPSTVVQSGLSELGLYLGDGTTLEVAATFPDIDLISGVSLRILVKVLF